jgi:hypothetical protein
MFRVRILVRDDGGLARHSILCHTVSRAYHAMVDIVQHSTLTASSLVLVSHVRSTGDLLQVISYGNLLEHSFFHEDYI